MSELVVKDGPDAGRRVEVNGEVVIGREDAGLTIEDAEMSRRHAVVRVSGSAVEIEDLGSRNGTYVNGTRITGMTRLNGGDSIKVGTTVIEFDAPRAAETVASPVAAPIAPASPLAGVAPSEPFGAYLAPAAKRPTFGIASRQLLPLLFSWIIVAAVAVTLIIYFGYHH